MSDDDRIELTSLEALRKVTAEGNRVVLEQLIAAIVQYLYEEGVERDRIASIATPAVFTAYRKYLEYAEPGWAAIERDIVGGLPH